MNDFYIYALKFLYYEHLLIFVQPITFYICNNKRMLVNVKIKNRVIVFSGVKDCLLFGVSYLIGYEVK